MATDSHTIWFYEKLSSGPGKLGAVQVLRAEIEGAAHLSFNPAVNLGNLLFAGHVPQAEREADPEVSPRFLANELRMRHWIEDENYILKLKASTRGGC
jgi:hypothetical protein